MSLTSPTSLSLKLRWPVDAPNGRWLDKFISLLTLLPSKSESREQLAAFSALWEVASDFMKDSFDSEDEASWEYQITAAANWSTNQSFMTNDAFKRFVANNCKSVMSYKDVVAYIEDNQATLFGPFASDDALKEIKAYLKRLRDLRRAVRVFAQFLDMSSQIDWTDPFSGQTYHYNPRKLYEEFKSHYAYETALCIPMY